MDSFILKICFTIIFLWVFISGTNGQSAESKTAGASGKGVSEEVANLIENSSIFNPDHRFMIRVAWVESKFGTDGRTYRAGYDGGIWQVDKIGFEDSKNTKAHPGLNKLFEKIQSKFGITWTQVKWNDLRKPLYSGIAARLLLSNKPTAIPVSVKDQAAYWKKYYNSGAGKGSEAKFVKDVQVLEG